MARFVDLEEDDHDAGSFRPEDLILKIQHAKLNNPHHEAVAPSPKPTSEQPRVDSAATRAFQCYPIVVSIVSSIDLTTLDALARTAFYIHQGLIQYRTTLINATLHCSNEAEPVDKDETLRYRVRASNWLYMDDAAGHSGKAGNCARDLVRECRRCGDVVCRNCAIKPPAPIATRERHRRLCNTCSTVPIGLLVEPPLDPTVPIRGSAIEQTMCNCDIDGVWLCQPCGSRIRDADHEYTSIWRWRNHYGEVLGGLGTGIGDGDRGVPCGRESRCLAYKEKEHEIDCDAEDARSEDLLHHNSTPSPQPLQDFINPIDQLFLHGDPQERASTPQLGPGYARHEIVGIGGVVKRKLVVMVKIGACVPEFEDERGMGRRPLRREVSGSRRSWCGWCWRVIPHRTEMLRGE